MTKKHRLLDSSRLGNQFGARIRRLRESFGMTQKGLAQRVGLPQNYVSQIETGAYNNPTLALITRLADGLGVPTAALVDDSNQRSDQEIELLGAIRMLPDTVREHVTGIVKACGQVDST
jgi:transcriptional regulator with XRE-family HTH domain